MPDPADDIALAETVGIALRVVLDRLTPQERVAFVLHDSFGFEFSTIAAILDTSPTGRSLTRSWPPREVATFFNGSAKAALSAFVGERPGAAWFHREQAMVLFDFTIANGLVEHITFRADPDVIARVVRRDGALRHSLPNEKGTTT